MQVAFRVDASPEIGSGHFMRCLTLADAARQGGARAVFLSRRLPIHFRDLLGVHGHGIAELGGDGPDGLSSGLAHASWLGTSQSTDAAEVLRALNGSSFDWMVVDHYALDERWERAIRRGLPRILAVDDLADRVHDCDLLLDQNLFPNMDVRYLGKVPAHCACLLGPRFALLRDEFRRLRDEARPRTGNVERVLVAFGGVDAQNYTAAAIEALTKGPRTRSVDVVIGAEHPDRDGIAAACDVHGFTCHVQTARMAPLMATADLGIGAGGSSCWERCCMALPAICVATAANQVAIIEGLRAHGAIVALGDRGRPSARKLMDALVDLVRDPQRVRAMSNMAAELVDGLGAPRVWQRMVA